MASAALKSAMSALASTPLEAPALAPSKLGTQAHWNSTYAREIRSFAECGDEGEVWFGEDAAEEMVEWALENIQDKAVKTLDVGSGNGQLLFAMQQAGYSNLTGIDYSPASITLSESIARSRDSTGITFSTCDIISEEIAGQVDEKWGLILDKGTYDAISLSDEIIDGKALNSFYPSRIARLLSPTGIFLITSCNWTRKELEAAFITPETGLKYHSHLPRPVFEYGGAVGQTITTIAFQLA